MKKILIPILCLLLALLCSCGKTPAPSAETTEAPSEAESTAAAEKEPVSWDDGDFLYLKGALPEGWEINDLHTTSTYLEAFYGEDESAPRITVSVITYDDEMGAEKTRILSEKVHERESDNASDVETSKIGGLDFYHMSYNSMLSEKARCYVFFGQTVPDENKEYKFVEIQIDNIKDAKQYDSLKNVLDQLSFKF